MLNVHACGSGLGAGAEEGRREEERGGEERSEDERSANARLNLTPCDSGFFAFRH
jgi:hypothetical protein